MQHSMPNTTSMFLSEHNEAMKYVEKLLYFLSAAEIGLLSFGNLESTAGTLIAFSFLFLFFAYSFWILHSMFESSNIQFMSKYKNAPDDHPVHQLTDFYDRKSRQAAYSLIALIAASAITLFCGLMDQFTDEILLPALSVSVTIFVFVLSFLVLITLWVFGYMASAKSLEDFE